MANSFKSMRVSGVIKRTDTGMFIRYSDLHVVDGFNRRVETDASLEADENLYQYMSSGGQVPALEVVPSETGGVEIVEGHRRKKTYGRMIEAGKPIEWIPIVPFKGNDVERKARIMTSQGQLKLTTYEESLVVKDLAAFHLTPNEIAKMVNCSRTKVDQLLAFSHVNHDVQMLVKEGSVALHVAVDKVKKHGSNAVEELKKDVATAKAAGKKRVTTSVAAKQFSAQMARRLVELMSAFEFTDDGYKAPDEVYLEAMGILAEYREKHGAPVQASAEGETLETKLPLLKDDIISQSGVTTWACAAAAFGDKAEFTFSESKYAHTWASDSLENPQVVVIPAETIRKAVELVDAYSSTDELRAFVDKHYADETTREDMFQRFSQVYEENRNFAPTAADFLRLLNCTLSSTWANVRELRAAVKSAIKELSPEVAG